MDDATKQQVKADLVEEARTRLASARQTLEVEDDATQIDDTEPMDAEDRAQGDEVEDRRLRREEATRRLKDDLSRLEDLDVSVVDRVGPGAIVSFGGGHYVVGVVSAPVESGGVTYEGLSTDAPAYEQIQGLQAGDTFTLGGREQRLDDVS